MRRRVEPARSKRARHDSRARTGRCSRSGSSAFLLNRCVVVISVAASGLALATITYEATRLAVLTGLSMFGGPLVSLVVSQLLLASSDRVRPRTALMCQMGAGLVSDALQLVPGMPWQARFGLLAIPYVAYAMFAGTTWALVREIVPEGSYILARSTMNLAEGGMQVVGYGVGGLALLWLSPRGLFPRRCPRRPAGPGQRAVRYPRSPGAHGPVAPALGTEECGPPQRSGELAVVLVARHPAAVHRAMGAERPRSWVASRCSSPGTSGSVGHGAVAGWLFATTAAGMMAGDLLVGRFVPPGWRDRSIEPLRLLLAVPYLLFLSPLRRVAIAVPLAFLASAGYAASLPLQDRLIRHTDDAIQGQVLGLHLPTA